MQISENTENKSAATRPQLSKHSQTISEILSQVHPAVCAFQSEGHASSRTRRTWAPVLVMCVEAVVRACKASPLTHSPALLTLHEGSKHHCSLLLLLLGLGSVAERAKDTPCTKGLSLLLCLYNSDLPAVTMFKLLVFETLHILVVFPKIVKLYFLFSLNLKPQSIPGFPTSHFFSFPSLSHSWMYCPGIVQ